MKLNHLDLNVSDVPSLTRFLVEHFGLEALTRLDSPKLAVLSDGAGFTLVLQHGPDGDGLGHIGFLVDDPAEVHARRAALAGAGVEVSAVSADARGTRCYLRAHGVLIEVGCNVGRLAVTAR